MRKLFFLSLLFLLSAVAIAVSTTVKPLVYPVVNYAVYDATGYFGDTCNVPSGYVRLVDGSGNFIDDENGVCIIVPE